MVNVLCQSDYGTSKTKKFRVMPFLEIYGFFTGNGKWLVKKSVICWN